MIGAALCEQPGCQGAAIEDPGSKLDLGALLEPLMKAVLLKVDCGELPTSIVDEIDDYVARSERGVHFRHASGCRLAV